MGLAWQWHTPLQLGLSHMASPIRGALGHMVQPRTQDEEAAGLSAIVPK